ncbi:MAG: phosphate signaling complex protein PhoU [Myxococcota bacterium]|jgi:phosphate transport system protein|nr:phosphate signaling complex protein PhoU [Myxococcota bacterium]
MSRRFNEDLSKLKREVLAMGALAEGMIRKTMSALVDRNPALIQEVLADEVRMDAFQRAIDTETVRLIGIFTPVAGDLRVLLMITRINAELERCADQAVSICYGYENLKLLEGEPLKPLVDLPRMASIAEQMFHDSMEAFVHNSAEEAMAVIKQDDDVDKLNDQIFRELLTYMLSDPRNISRALGLILTARAFERIADHAVNIAEDVVYIVRGEDIRHVKA